MGDENTKIIEDSEIDLKYNVMKSELQILEKKRKSKPKYILCILASILFGFLILWLIYGFSKDDYGFDIKNFYSQVCH